ncbi:MAG: hypothetical protein AB7L91_07785 [Dehalococcoidia bacterium]
MEQPNRRYEAKPEASGSWTIVESLGGSVVSQSSGLTARAAKSEAVRLNRDEFRKERAIREQNAKPQREILRTPGAGDSEG